MCGTRGGQRLTQLPWINPDAFSPKSTRPTGELRLYKKKTIKTDYSMSYHRADLIEGLNAPALSGGSIQAELGAVGLAPPAVGCTLDGS